MPSAVVSQRTVESSKSGSSEAGGACDRPRGHRTSHRRPGRALSSIAERQRICASLKLLAGAVLTRKLDGIGWKIGGVHEMVNWIPNHVHVGGCNRLASSGGQAAVRSRRRRPVRTDCCNRAQLRPVGGCPCKRLLGVTRISLTYPTRKRLNQEHRRFVAPRDHVEVWRRMVTEVHLDSTAIESPYRRQRLP
jgi:hypothetical protein